MLSTLGCGAAAAVLQAGPRRVLIVKKPVPAAAAQLEEMANWLEQQGLQVHVGWGRPGRGRQGLACWHRDSEEHMAVTAAWPPVVGSVWPAILFSQAS